MKRKGNGNKQKRKGHIQLMQYTQYTSGLVSDSSFLLNFSCFLRAAVSQLLLLLILLPLILLPLVPHWGPLWDPIGTQFGPSWCPSGPSAFLLLLLLLPIAIAYCYCLLQLLKILKSLKNLKSLKISEKSEIF